MSTLKTIKETVLKDIETDSINYQIYLKVFDALKKHDGEKISKRLATTVQKALELTHDVYYKPQYGMFYISIRRKGEPSSAFREFLIGYDSNPVFRLESGDINASQGARYTERGFDYFSCCYGRAAKERIEKNQKILKSGELEKLAKLHDKKKKLEKEIEALELESFDFPAKFAVDRALRGEQ